MFVLEDDDICSCAHFHLVELIWHVKVNQYAVYIYTYMSICLVQNFLLFNVCFQKHSTLIIFNTTFKKSIQSISQKFQNITFLFEK